MKMNTDSFFAIGQKHVVAGKPCQDYAMSDEQDEGRIAFAVVSDGCSSGRNTDIGARLIVLATMQAIREYWSENMMIMPWMTEWISKQRAHIIEKIDLGLSIDDLLATSIYAFLNYDGGFVRGLVCVQGDGVVAVKYRDGSVSMMRFDWPNETPFYPAYKGSRLNNFIQNHGGDLCAKVVTEEKWLMDRDGNFSNREDIFHSMKDGIDGIKKSFVITDEIEYVAIFSDGVTRVTSVDWKDATRSFMSFKNNAGEFAKRRMIAGIKDSMKIGKGPFDDISYAVIHLNYGDKEGGGS